ncbi:adenylate cyclase [Solidesulfovibrio fructosivorans JJ]]|uniref:Adenylate cyclase n=1 Tax=Solidesulfovibrio fructosivorans JJ] TaxID=596151 RepID=E1K146_SOLFR|nr:class IV adenylate cyclase [Solidesulfovibrio fructosivorans]EFL49673.1 adenylate cyclase [Solidesulfovibrio fructosivorans JJ]]
MPRNVEIKAKIDSVDAMLSLAAKLADAGPTELLQDDTFFPCPNGRLKLRAFPDGTGELIFYQRPDSQGPKTSEYTISPTHAPDTLRQTLTAAYGQAGRVRKKRTLFLIGRTRLHLDAVEGLGDFLELEVVLEPTESATAGEATAKALLVQLGISQEQLVAKAYVDLLAGGG